MGASDLLFERGDGVVGCCGPLSECWWTVYVLDFIVTDDEGKRIMCVRDGYHSLKKQQYTLNNK